MNAHSRLLPRFNPLLAILALTAALLAFSGCTKRGDDGKLQVFHGQLKDDVKSMDPANAYDEISWEVLPNICESLYQYSYLNSTYQVEPLLAADMPKVSKDRLTYTIPLKHGVRFSDNAVFKATGGKGRELKAQDFIFAWKRLALPSLQSQGWWIFDGKIEGINAFHDKLAAAKGTEQTAIMNEPVSGILALDDYTIQIKLVKPYPQLMYILIMPFTAAVPSEALALADEKGNLTDTPIGTGPFVLKSWEHGRRIVLDRNPNYHADFYPTDGSPEFRRKGLLVDAGKPLPFLDRVTMDIIKEDQPRWLNFMSGDKDVIYIPKDNYGQVLDKKGDLIPEMKAKGTQLNIESGVTIRYVTFNVLDKLMANKTLRQALSAAIDREKWIEIFTYNTGRKMLNALPPGVAGRPEHSKIRYDFDLKHAKELLKKAGYPNGEGLPTINFDLRGADSMSRQLGEFMTQQWNAIGVKVNVVPNTFPAYLEKMKQGALQTSYGGWGLDYPDAENIYQLVYGPNKSPGPNDSNYDSPIMNKLYEQMAVLEPNSKRSALIQQIDDLLQEDAPWALGYNESRYYLTQPWIQNYRAADIILNKYKYYRVDPTKRAARK